jgi:ElaB/YqjD/DUF883 family membrane-anchored ribosome-binding protein
MNSKFETSKKNEGGVRSDDLARDLNNLRDDVSSAAGNMRDAAGEALHDGLQKGREVGRETARNFDGMRHKVESQVRSNPLTAIGVAFAAGMMIALLRRK